MRVLVDHRVCGISIEQVDQCIGRHPTLQSIWNLDSVKRYAWKMYTQLSSWCACVNTINQLHQQSKGEYQRNAHAAVGSTQCRSLCTLPHYSVQWAIRNPLVHCLIARGSGQCKDFTKHVWSLGKISCAAACCGMLLPAHVGTYASVGN